MEYTILRGGVKAGLTNTKKGASLGGARIVKAKEGDKTLRKLTPFTTSAVLLLSSSLFATTIRVPQDQPTIQAGINAAVSWDTVQIFPGTYTENIVIFGKNIRLVSIAGPKNTIITRAITGVPVVRLIDTDTFSTFEGFTVQNGIGDGFSDNVRLSNSSARFQNNIIQYGAGISFGTGLLANDGTPIISGNIFRGNNGDESRVIEFIRGSPTLERNFIVENRTSAAIFIHQVSQFVAINNTIVNSPGSQYGFWIEGGSLGSVTNNIIAHNLSYGIGFEAENPPITVSYNDFFDNHGFISGNYQGVGNITADPLFVGESPFEHELNYGSPCIDAGDPTTPVPPDGGARVDIGALEFSGIGLILPGNEDIVTLRKPQFIWTRRDTAISATYRLLLDTSSSFSAPDSSPPLSDTSWRFPNPLKLTQQYYWKVFAVPDSGDTVLSRVKTFFLTPVVDLYLPTNSSRVLVKQPTFIWGAVHDTSIVDTFTYRVIYSNTPDFTGAKTSSILSDTVWQPTLPLEVGHTYFWRVLAFYSSLTDTLLPRWDFRFLLAPTRIEVPDDRPTIQQAIDISLNGDTVWVRPGTYYEHILFKGKNIKLLSEGGPEVTVIQNLTDGVPLVSFANWEGTSTLLKGFTLTGARLVPNGAAIKITNASPLIENNFIVNNSGDAGAIWVENGSPIIRRNLIAGDNGQAAIRFSGFASGELINCTIANNTGAGVFFGPLDSGITIRLTNNIIAFNSDYGINSGGCRFCQAVLTYNDVFGNIAGNYFGVTPSAGSISLDPQFLSGDPFDYHLADTSPCIDAGDPSFPIPPGGGFRVDMGAFETLRARGDLNRDGILSPSDVVLELNCVFISAGNCALADVNCDGQLSPADVMLEINATFLGIPLPC